MNPPRERTKVGQGTEALPQRWMNPLAKIQWRQAIKARKTTFELEGRKYILDYKRQKGYVLIKPEKGFWPLAWVSLERVDREDGEWIVSD